SEKINYCNYWFYFEDSYYLFNEKSLFEEIKTILPFNIKQNSIILKFPTELEIIQVFKNQFQEQKNIIVISNNPPNENTKNLFILKKIKNYFGILTSQMKEENISEEKALEEKLGMSVIKSPFTLNDVGGAYALKEYTKQLINAEKKGFKAKGIFLVGIPGTGKTFFPKCFSGELNRKLILLNLSEIVEHQEPIKKINEIFNFLDKRAIEYPDEKFVILIDEIEKMIGNVSPKEKQMLGRLLTVLNDINTPTCEYKFNAIFFATANDLNSILDNNPEFLRRGRWDELFFINLPTHEYAEEIFKIYIKKQKLEFILDIMSLNSIFAEIEHMYMTDNPISSRFPYTPAEIENFCKRIDFVRKGIKDEELTEEHIKEAIKMIIPIAISARKGIERMVGQKELFIEI
ncbi:ATP-binding protein, partial [Campylobacter coli]|nr:ATP-binding protein [Campylobacter coli]EHA2273253.1 ATP-binding protein [Campylobacter coli]